ncbi:hypothetical protein ACFWM7_01390 [Streptomyces sp. NPDC058375]|uniref:hypothetical protein n=1 Tax=Streptomyces sp. NPDC058375 TaxID=3346467 RepID=UPI00365754E5
MFGAQTPSVDEQRQTFMEGLMTVRSTVIAPLFDTADGMKADLAARGWSETVAEHLAATWLASMLAKVGEAA